MASWYVGGTEMSRSLSDSSLPTDRGYDHHRYIGSRKRRLSDCEYFDLRDDSGILPQWKRPRFVDYCDEYHSERSSPSLTPAFFIIKEATLSLPSLDCGSSGSSGNDQTALVDLGVPQNYVEATTQFNFPLQYLKVKGPAETVDATHPPHTKDKNHDAAAKLVEDDLANSRRRGRLSQHERILRSLIYPKSLEAEFEIDDEALQAIFYAANEIFFRGRLKGRVTWAWEELPSSLIGTTALRKSPKSDGYETLIYLSRQILKDKIKDETYNRRLLISTFIHELIHSYLFVYCGFHTGECGGHTNGFQRIAKLIDEWAGPDLLYLCNMEAELSYFETVRRRGMPEDHVFHPCRIQWLRDGTPGYSTYPSVEHSLGLEPFDTFSGPGLFPMRYGIWSPDDGISSASPSQEAF